LRRVVFRVFCKSNLSNTMALQLRAMENSARHSLRKQHWENNKQTYHDSTILIFQHAHDSANFPGKSWVVIMNRSSGV